MHSLVAVAVAVAEEVIVDRRLRVHLGLSNNNKDQQQLHPRSHLLQKLPLLLQSLPLTLATLLLITITIIMQIQQLHPVHPKYLQLMVV